jgi:hypothetical protein
MNSSTTALQLLTIVATHFAKDEDTHGYANANDTQKLGRSWIRVASGGESEANALVESFRDTDHPQVQEALQGKRFLFPERLGAPFEALQLMVEAAAADGSPVQAERLVGYCLIGMFSKATRMAAIKTLLAFGNGDKEADLNPIVQFNEKLVRELKVLTGELPPEIPDCLPEEL